jgi:hypothetical protein
LIRSLLISLTHFAALSKSEHDASTWGLTRLAVILVADDAVFACVPSLHGETESLTANLAVKPTTASLRLENRVSARAGDVSLQEAFACLRMSEKPTSSPP